MKHFNRHILNITIVYLIGFYLTALILGHTSTNAFYLAWPQSILLAFIAWLFVDAKPREIIIK